MHVDFRLNLYCTAGNATVTKITVKKNVHRMSSGSNKRIFKIVWKSYKEKKGFCFVTSAEHNTQG